jgi:hypothetical protein
MVCDPPATDLEPANPAGPVAVQEVGEFVVAQVIMVELAGAVNDDGLAVMVTVMVGVAVKVTVRETLQVPTLTTTVFVPAVCDHRSIVMRFGLKKVAVAGTPLIVI